VTREITIAAVQLPSASPGGSNADKRTANFHAAVSALEEAGQRGVEVACLGETFNTTGITITRETLGQVIDGAVELAVELLSPVARRHHMVVIAPVLGLLEGVASNAALVLDRSGKLAGAYCKVHPTQAERALGVVPGNRWPVFDLGFGGFGIQICHDNSFSESARCLALNGAEIIFWPHVMSGWGDELMGVMLRAPAIYNGVVHVPVCYGCRPDQAWRPGMLIGHSSIIAPDGITLADAGRYPGLAVARVDLDRPRLAHSFTREGDHHWRDEMLADRRPDLYLPITRAAAQPAALATLAAGSQAVTP
jgi:N-carbamoylputrescine amidase